MVRKEVKVTNQQGLHLRPCGMISNAAAKYKSDISIISDGVKVNAKSIMSLLILGAHKGSTVIIEANGVDENEAIDEIVKLFENNFDEE
jgi:phosphocarrier protein HPr